MYRSLIAGLRALLPGRSRTRDRQLAPEPRHVTTAPEPAPGQQHPYTWPPLPSPHHARWRRWSARSQRHRAEHGRWLPLLAREPCWESPPARPKHLEDVYVDVADIVRPYVTASLCEERSA